MDARSTLQKDQQPAAAATVLFHEQAEFLRESSGSTNVQKTLLKALSVFKFFNIPHYVCDGFAVQEHGYPRFTVDVDIIVPDVELAREKLTMPTQVADTPQILTLEALISSKLSTYLGRGIERAQTMRTW